MEETEQGLIELIADFLDSEMVLIQQSISETKDPVEREESDLHIKMAKAAMKVYKDTMVSSYDPGFVDMMDSDTW